MHRILKVTKGHPLTKNKIVHLNVPCQAYSLGQLITRPFPTSIDANPFAFVQRIQGDICRTNSTTTSTRWSHGCLLSTGNAASTKIMA